MDWSEVKYRIGVLVILLSILIGIKCCEADQYNNGIHEGCGGHLIYQQAIGHRYTTAYVFKCDKCGAILEFDDDTATPIYFEDDKEYEVVE